MICDLVISVRCLFGGGKTIALQMGRASRVRVVFDVLLSLRSRDAININPRCAPGDHAEQAAHRVPIPSTLAAEVKGKVDSTRRSVNDAAKVTGLAQTSQVKSYFPDRPIANP